MKISAVLCRYKDVNHVHIMTTDTETLTAAKHVISAAVASAPMRMGVPDCQEEVQLVTIRNIALALGETIEAAAENMLKS